ncbi:MAG TPA: isoleucine--tRNA ligase [Polyangiaceae bacterium]|nr:isoleucine--tRNA ligase [Polyangiaceae bacterium]
MTEPVFTKVPAELDFPKEEGDILAFWRSIGVFEKCLARPATRGTWVFYEGPPTANGLPHNGHVLTRVVKDLFPRYKTMRGYHVPRKAGWDTHGLPVEVEVEKELHIHGKAAIEAYGVEPFVKKCIDSVFRYTSEWESLTERVGFWVDLEKAYVTYHRSYVESVWWALSELFKKGLLYQGHKVVWWWAQGGTALSSGEVGQGYKQVDDPSVYVSFPLRTAAGAGALEGAELLVWTTTPWTLPSNMYAAVNASFTYVVADLGGRKLVLAEGLLEGLAKKLKVDAPVVLARLPGRDLVGLAYEPPYDLYAAEAALPTAARVWKVLAADFVTLDAGTGVVHVAPAFGEDDHLVHRKLLAEEPALPLFCAVKPDGTFVDAFAPYAGRWVKDCDKDLQADLKQRGKLVLAETYRHDYPFCWRADSDPLIQYARPAWYIRTTSVIEKAKANNQAVNWFPPHIKDGRFGDFLDNNVDWALSRERYWGTPLNVWVNDATGKLEAPCSVAEILAKNPRAFDSFHAAKAADPTLSDDLLVHKPWVDAVTWQNPGEEGTYRRVPEVIDCWFDSGCMPFAQWGFPHAGEAEFKQSFPADFISEAIDQTRGWFYSLLMISTLVFDEEARARLGLAPESLPHPYRSCIVLGHVCDKEGKKESKSKGNYTPPDVIFDDVKMDFLVAADVENGPPKGTAYVSREDLEGLDLTEGREVSVFRAGVPEVALSLKVQVVAKVKLRRRAVLLSREDREALGVAPAGDQAIKVIDVPTLPDAERVVVRDPAASAPGADAFRWFFYASNPPWSSTRHSLSNVRATQKETLVRLRNVYAFFTLYANIDGFSPTDSAPPVAERSELDRWITSALHATIAKVTEALDGYDVHGATTHLTDLVDGLSNWYVRRSRERFWRAWSGAATPDAGDLDKRAAYATLYEVLVALAKVLAPFVPFAAEGMFQNLVRRVDAGAPESVHLADWPAAEPALVDDELSRRMAAVRELVSLGLQVRTSAKLKVRQPLRVAHLVLGDAKLRASLAGSGAAMIQDELNVLDVAFVDDAEVERFVSYKLKPNFRTLGQRGLGKEAQLLKKSLGALDAARAAALLAALREAGTAEHEGVTLLVEDVEVAFEAREGFAAAGGRAGVVVLDTRLDDELRELGLVREVANRVQNARKEAKLELADRVTLRVHAPAALLDALAKHQGALAADVLATSIELAPSPSDPATRAGAHVEACEVEGMPMELVLRKA